MICENCGLEHIGSYGSGRFCCSKCARGFSTKNKRLEINQKVSNTCKNKKQIKFIKCKCCGNVFEKTSNVILCSDKCRFELKSKAAKLGRETAKKNGTFSEWKVRTSTPSYPEQYFINLFQAENIDGFVREFPFGKWFIDFAFIDKKIAIEIDGKQHEYPERKLKDLEKDDFLIANKWEVFRIKWKNPVNDMNKQFLYKQIDEMKKKLRQ